MKEENPVTTAKMLVQRFPELKLLAGNVNETPEGKINGTGRFVSEKLFDEKHVEFDRTFASIQCLKQVLNDDYEGFTENQKENVKLTR